MSLRNTAASNQPVFKMPAFIFIPSLKNIFKYLPVTLFLAIGTFVLLPTFMSAKNGAVRDCPGSYRIEGYKSYINFVFKKSMKLPPETVPGTCIYEFYEGVYEASGILGDRYSNLDKVCAFVSSYMPAKSWNQCYFRIGTALTFTKRNNLSDPDKLQKFTDSKIKFCEGLKNNSVDCIAGVYTGIDLAFINDDRTSVFPIKNNDPFWICKVGAGNTYKLNCYRNTVSFLYNFTNGDMDKAVSILDNDLPSPFERFEIKLTFFSSLAYLPGYKYSDVHKLCLSFKNRETRYSCIEGYATGLDEVLANGLEGPGVVDFCLNSPLSYDEKGECLRRGFFELPTTWDLNVKKQTCEDSVPSVFKSFCNVEKAIPLPY